jgi:hypothetical protein
MGFNFFLTIPTSASCSRKMSSKQEARKAVKAIADTHGFIEEHIWKQLEEWNPDIRRTLEHKMNTKDKRAAKAIETYVSLTQRIV